MAERTSAVATELSQSAQQTVSVPATVIPLHQTGPDVWVMLPVLFVGSFLIRLVCLTGLIGSDDMFYSNYGQAIATGSYKLEATHYAVRYGLLLPLSASYRLFGLHEWTTILVPLISSSLAAPLLALIAARLAGIRQAWIAGLLMATFPVAVRYGSILVPEPVLETLLLIAALLFLLAQAHDSSILAAAAGVLLGISYLTKEPAAFVAMAFFLFLVAMRRWKLAFVMGCGVAFVLLGEVGWYWKESGDVLFRIHAMAWNNSSDMAVAANQNLFYRLFKEYPRMMLVPSTDYGLHSLLALGLSAAALVSRRSASTLWLLLWAIFPFLYLNFGTSSFRYFWALPSAPRYLGLIYEPLFVLAAIALVSLANSNLSKKLVGSSLVLVVCAVGVACAFVTRDAGYRTAQVAELRKIVSQMHHDQSHICEFAGPDAKVWRETVQIIAPEQLGCAGQLVVQLAPDSQGLPTITHPR